MSGEHVIIEKPSDEAGTLEKLRRRERELPAAVENAYPGLHWIGTGGSSC